MKKESNFVRNTSSAIVGLILAAILTPILAIGINMVSGKIVFNFLCKQYCANANNAIYALFISILIIVFFLLRTFAFGVKK